MEIYLGIKSKRYKIFQKMALLIYRFNSNLKKTKDFLKNLMVILITHIFMTA